MAYSEQEARALVVQAGHRLLEAGLIARTWGNISARVSDAQFVITPSGLAYETLRPEQLVKVNLADCTYEGGGKPSSEKGIHADAYRLRPEVQFVIHTHQDKASIFGVAGEDLTGLDDPVLGGCVPCAAYGMPSTKKLRSAVAAAEQAHRDSAAILLRHHGALCLGRDFDHAFALADALEAACAARLPAPEETAPPPDCGCSVRKGQSFRLDCGGTSAEYRIDAAELPPAAALHAAVYRTCDARCIAHETAASVVAVSAAGRTLRPLLDDLAQIAGTDIRCAEVRPADAAGKLKGRNAVLLRGAGALCTGGSAWDVEAVRILLRKGCAAAQYAATRPGCRPLGRLDALAQRMIYVKKYAKRGREGAPC